MPLKMPSARFIPASRAADRPLKPVGESREGEERDKIDGVVAPLVPCVIPMFKETLRDLVENTEGGLAGLLMDSSGITLESYAKGDSPFDINAIGIEFGVVIGQIKRAAEMLEAGNANEIAVGTDRLITIIRTLGETYFLALALTPSGNFGKGRYLMRTAAPKLMAEL